MELIQMQAFVSLAQTQHMPRTAQEMNTSQSHISKLISSLEAELGMKLFNRVGRGVVLNEHGRIFYEYAYRNLLEEEFYAVLSPKLIPYPADKKSIRLEELKPYPLIEVADSPFYQNWLFQGQNVKQLRELFGTTFRVGYTVNDFYAKVSLLDQGLGFSFFPQVCLKPALRFAPDLQIFRIEGHTTARRVLVARKQREQMTPAARAFWNFLLEYYHLDPDAGED